MKVINMTVNSTFSNYQTSFWNQTDNLKPHVQKGLLALTSAAAVMSVIPPLRSAGSLAMRSIALCSSSLGCIKKEVTACILSCAKVGVVSLGVAAIVAAKPVLFIASLVADIAVQSLEMIKAVYANYGFQIFANISAIVIDTLALSALTTGSWPLMVVASCVNAGVMTVFAFKAIDNDNGLESLCYSILAAVGYVGAFSALQISKTRYTDSHFSIENESNEKVVFYDKHGEIIASANPREATQFDIPYKDTFQYQKTVVYPGVNNSGPVIVPVHYGSYVLGAATDMKKYNAFSIGKEIAIIKHSLPVNEFPTLPVGGNVIVHPADDKK